MATMPMTNNTDFKGPLEITYPSTILSIANHLNLFQSQGVKIKLKISM